MIHGAIGILTPGGRYPTGLKPWSITDVVTLGAGANHGTPITRFISAEIHWASWFRFGDGNGQGCSYSHYANFTTAIQGTVRAIISMLPTIPGTGYPATLNTITLTPKILWSITKSLERGGNG